MRGLVWSKVAGSGSLSLAVVAGSTSNSYCETTWLTAALVVSRTTFRPAHRTHDDELRTGRRPPVFPLGLHDRLPQYDERRRPQPQALLYRGARVGEQRRLLRARGLGSDGYGVLRTRSDDAEQPPQRDPGGVEGEQPVRNLARGIEFSGRVLTETFDQAGRLGGPDIAVEQLPEACVSRLVPGAELCPVRIGPQGVEQVGEFLVVSRFVPEHDPSYRARPAR